MKRIFMLIMVLALGLCAAACGNAGDTAAENSADHAVSGADGTKQEGETAMLGGWQTYEGEAYPLPYEVQDAFDKACETLTGAQLIPTAYVGRQVVSGTNYMLLCRMVPSTEELAEDAGTYQMVVIYADLQGGAEITHMTDFSIGDYTETEGAGTEGETLTGGWTVPEHGGGGSLPEEAQEAFDKASEGSTGNDLVPLALLGTQTVSGKNYAILCYSSLATEEPAACIQVVTVYADLDGNASFTNICTLDPADYNQ